MKILNLGCGTKTSNSEDIINIDWSILLRIKKNFFLSKLLLLLLNDERKEKFRNIPNNILVHNLKKGIPFKDNSIDAVYSSHVLEHIERKYVPHFLTEILRVLKPNAINRIVVPDMYFLTKKYVENYKKCCDQNEFSRNHDRFIANIIEQSVRREASGTSKQKKLSRKIENLLLGDARKRGETHQWMYDNINLGNILLDVGYSEVKVQSFLTSDIPEWDRYGLDKNKFNQEYKTHSLYIEARK